MVPLFYIDLSPINRMGIRGYSNLSTQSIERRGNSELPVVHSSIIIKKIAVYILYNDTIKYVIWV